MIKTYFLLSILDENAGLKKKKISVDGNPGVKFKIVRSVCTDSRWGKQLVQLKDYIYSDIIIGGKAQPAKNFFGQYFHPKKKVVIEIAKPRHIPLRKENISISLQ